MPLNELFTGFGDLLKKGLRSGGDAIKTFTKGMSADNPDKVRAASDRAAGARAAPVQVDNSFEAEAHRVENAAKARDAAFNNRAADMNARSKAAGVFSEADLQKARGGIGNEPTDDFNSRRGSANSPRAEPVQPPAAPGQNRSPNPNVSRGVPSAEARAFQESGGGRAGPPTESNAVKGGIGKAASWRGALPTGFGYGATGALSAGVQATSEAEDLGKVFSDENSSTIDKLTQVGEAFGRSGGAGAGAMMGAKLGMRTPGGWIPKAVGTAVLGGVGGFLGARGADLAIKSGRALTGATPLTGAIPLTNDAGVTPGAPAGPAGPGGPMMPPAVAADPTINPVTGYQYPPDGLPVYGKDNVPSDLRGVQLDQVPSGGGFVQKTGSDGVRGKVNTVGAFTPPKFTPQQEADKLLTVDERIAATRAATAGRAGQMSPAGFLGGMMGHIAKVKSSQAEQSTSLARDKFYAERGDKQRAKISAAIDNEAEANTPQDSASVEPSKSNRPATVKRNSAILRQDFAYTAAKRGTVIENLSDSKVEMLMIGSRLKAKYNNSTEEAGQQVRGYFGDMGLESKDIASFLPQRVEESRLPGSGRYTVHLENGAVMDIKHYGGGRFKLFKANTPLDKDMMDLIRPFIKEHKEHKERKKGEK